MMKFRIYLIIILQALLIAPALCQDKKEDVSRRLEDFFYWILNSSSDSERERLNDSVKVIVDSYVSSDTVMEHTFTKVRNLGQIISPDHKVKIVTWNLVLRDGSNRYFLYIIKSNGRKKPNTVYRLAGKSTTDPVKTDLIYTPENWYGAAYYAIQPFKAGKKVSYILLGIDLEPEFKNRKIIDVLNFDENGRISFGMKCFSRGKDLLARDVFEYSSEGVISLRMHTPRLVVFDHLDTYSSGHGNGEQNMGAGLFFDGYTLKKGIWNYVSNIEIRNRK